MLSLSNTLLGIIIIYSLFYLPITYRESWWLTSSNITSASVINPSLSDTSMTESSSRLLSFKFSILPDNPFGSVIIMLKLAILKSSLVPPGPSILYFDCLVSVWGTSLPRWVPLAWREVCKYSSIVIKLFLPSKVSMLRALAVIWFCCWPE